MKLFLVNYGHPYYISYVVAAKNGIEALDKAKEDQGRDLNNVQVSCFGIYDDVKILL